MAKNLTEGKTLKLLVNFALPLLGGNLFQQLYNIIDAAIVGQYLGSDALASVGATGSVQFMVLGFCIGICIGFGIPVAQHYGAENHKKMRDIIFHGAIAATVISILLAVFCSIFCGDIVTLLRIPEKLYQDAYNYLLVLFIGIPCSVLYNYLAGILRAVGDSKTPFIFLIISTVLNIAMDVIFIVVFHWGCTGAAVATITAQAISGVLCLVLILWKVDLLHVRRENCIFRWKDMGTVLIMGVPMGLQFSITAIGSMVMQAATNGLGNPDYISAFAATGKIKQFAMCPFDAVATAVSNFCSQNLGAGKFDRIRDGLKKGLVMAVSYGVFIGLVQIFFGRYLTMIFISADEVNVINAAAHVLFCAGIFFFLLGFLNVCRLTVQGLGYAVLAIVAGILEMIARVSVSLIFVPRFGFEAICFTDQSAWLAATVFIVPICFYLIRKKEKNYLAMKNQKC